MNRLLTILTLLISFACNGQYSYDAKKISPRVRKLAYDIEKSNIVMSNSQYALKMGSTLHNNCKCLFCIATKTELEELTNHPSGVVRCYAFKALNEQRTTKTLPIIIKHLEDTAHVKTLSGCIGLTERVSDVMILSISKISIDTPYYSLTENETLVLDSLLLSSPTASWAKRRVIDRAKEKKIYYSLLKKLYLREHNDQALIALASFRKEEDIPLILDHEEEEYVLYNAIEEFPHNRFFPILTSHVQDTAPPIAKQYEFSYLFKAIAAYKNDNAVKLLNIAYNKNYHTKTRQLVVNGIFPALQEHYTPIYDSLLWQLWTNNRKVNRYTFNLLYAKNRTKALVLAKNTINAADSIEDEYSYESDSIINTLLDTIKVHDKQTYIQLVQKNIATAKDHLFHVFANRASEMRDSATAEAFFTRLENEVVTSVYLEAAYQLILYKDKAINQRLLDFNKKHSSVYKANGDDDLTQMLKNYGIE